MKNIMLSLGIAITTMVAQANPMSHLTVELKGDGNFTVVLNGKKQNSQFNTFRFSHLRPGMYPIQVIRENYWGSPAVLYSGKVRIPVSSEVAAVLDQHNQLKVRFTPIQNSCGHGFIQNTGHYGYGQGSDPIGCDSPTSYTQHGMSHYAFGRTLDLMNDTPFDSDRILIARQAIRSNGINSEQVSKLMDLLSFDSSKLKLAKFAYGHVVDPENYFIINQGFAFSSSIRELDHFING